MSSSSTLVDSCPPTGLSVLVDLLLQFLQASTRNSGWISIHPRVSPFLLSAWSARDQTRYLSRSPGWILVPPTGLSVLDNWVFGFWFWIGFVGCLCCFQRLLNPILTSNYLWKKSSGEVEVIHILSRIWCLQIPSQQLSGYNKLAVCRKGWLRSILFGGTFNYLSLSKLNIDPIHRILVSLSTSSARTMQDVVWWSQAHADLCDLVHGIHSRKEHCLSFPAWILSSRYQSWICDGV